MTTFLANFGTEMLYAISNVFYCKVIETIIYSKKIIIMCLHKIEIVCVAIFIFFSDCHSKISQPYENLQALLTNNSGSRFEKGPLLVLSVQFGCRTVG